MGKMHYFLGFDGDCATCTKMAHDLEALSAGRLTARNLRDPEVQGWRERALGPDAPWTPTLFRVDGDKVRAWTGRGMARELVRVLGPRRAFQAMRLFDDVSMPATTSRRAFLRKLGTAAAMGSLLAFGKLPSVAAKPGKAHNPTDAFATVRSERLETAALHSLRAQVRANRDVKQVLASIPYKELPPAEELKAARHTLANGAELLTIGWAINEKYVAGLHILSGAEDSWHSRAFLYAVNGEESLTLLAASTDGQFKTRAIQPASGIDPGTGGGKDCSCGVWHENNCCWFCDSWDRSCIIWNCAECALSCFQLWTCAACIIGWCGMASAIRCCTHSWWAKCYC